MKKPSERAARRRGTVASLTSLVTVGLLVEACVIADPPTDFPELPAMRPTIVRASVVPTPSRVIGRWPDRFIVPVELADPRATIWWSAFVDYNPDTGVGLDGQPTQSDYESTSTLGRIRILEIPISTPTPPALDRCHVIEVVVALNLNTSDPKNAHTPLEPGGDIVTWFFNPSGDLAGCPTLDAGLPEPPPSDGGAE